MQYVYACNYQLSDSVTTSIDVEAFIHASLELQARINNEHAYQYWSTYS